MKTREEKAREYLIEKDFTGFANHSSVPSWMADFADKECAELKEASVLADDAIGLLQYEIGDLRSEIASLRSRLDDCKRRAITGQRI